MRKAGKKRIAAALREFIAWKAKTIPEVCRLTVPGAATVLGADIAYMETLILDGQLGFQVRGVSQHVWSKIKYCREGLYKSAELSPNGGATWYCNTFNG